MRIATSTIALLACTSIASAADLGGPYEPYGGSLKDEPIVAAPFSWTGFYVGAHVGHGWADNDVATTYFQDGSPAAPTATNSFDSDGWLGGFQAGYNHQVGPWVLGGEADFSFSDIKGSFSYDPTRPQKLAGGDIDWLMTVRGRIGHAFDNVLLYGTAGLAIAEVGGFVNNFWHHTDPADRATGSSTEVGWTVGGGLEVALSQNLSLKGEYLYMRFDDVSEKMRSPVFPTGAELGVDSDISLHTVRVGVNYKFGR